MSDTWRQVESFSRNLALAVKLTDGVVGGRPMGDPVVRVQGVDERPYRKETGHYLFFDLPRAEVTLEVDGGERYLDASKTVDLDPSGGAHDPGQAVEVTLDPTPAYRFPPGLTRVRGTVLDGTTPVDGATVTVAGNARTVEATDAGEFVYYFDVDPDDVVRYDPKPKDPTNDVERRYKPGGDHPKFEVSGPPGTFTERVVVEVGRLTTRNLNYQRSRSSP